MQKISLWSSFLRGQCPHYSPIVYLETFCRHLTKILVNFYKMHSNIYNTRYAQNITQTCLFWFKIIFICHNCSIRILSKTVTMHQPLTPYSLNKIKASYWLVVETEESRGTVTVHNNLYARLIACCATTTPPPSHHKSHHCIFSIRLCSFLFLPSPVLS